MVLFGVVFLLTKEVIPEANLDPVRFTAEYFEAEEGVVILEWEGMRDMLGVVDVRLIVR